MMPPILVLALSVAVNCVILPVRASDDIDTHLLAILLPTLLGVFIVLGIILGLIVWHQKRRSRQRDARRQALGVNAYADADEVAMEPGVESTSHHRGTAPGSRRTTPPARSTSTLRRPNSAAPCVDDEVAELEAEHPHADNDLRRSHREGSGADGDENAHSVSSSTHSPTPLAGVAIENRVRPRNHLPKGTVLVEQEDLQYRIDFTRLHDIPEAAPPPLSREERKRLEEEQNRVASPLFYGRAEYNSNGGSVLAYASYAGSYAGSCAGSVDGRASVDAYRHSANGSPYRTQDVYVSGYPGTGQQYQQQHDTSSLSGNAAIDGARFVRQASANSVGSFANASFGEPRRPGQARNRNPKQHTLGGGGGEFLESTSDDFDGVDDEAAKAFRAGLRQRHVSTGSSSLSTYPAMGTSGGATGQTQQQQRQHHQHKQHAVPRTHDERTSPSSSTSPPSPGSLLPLPLQETSFHGMGVSVPVKDSPVSGPRRTAEGSAASSITDYFASAPAPQPPSVNVLNAHVTPVVSSPSQASAVGTGTTTTGTGVTFPSATLPPHSFVDPQASVNSHQGLGT